MAQQRLGDGKGGLLGCAREGAVKNAHFLVKIFRQGIYVM